MQRGRRDAREQVGLLEEVQIGAGQGGERLEPGEEEAVEEGDVGAVSGRGGGLGRHGFFFSFGLVAWFDFFSLSLSSF